MEVVMAVLVLVLGVGTALGMTRLGQRMARDAQARALAMPTARSVVSDVKLMGVTPAEWSQTSAQVYEGTVNGLYVRRTLSDMEVLNQDQRAATVTVDVYWDGSSEQVLTLRERILIHGR